MARCPSCHRRLAPAAVCPRDGGRAQVATAFEIGAAPLVPGFALEAGLGSGGFATTWAARSADGRSAAVKVSRVPSLAAAERLDREAAALRRVGLPVVPEVYARGDTADGLPFLAMERVGGVLLADALAATP